MVPQPRAEILSRFTRFTSVAARGLCLAGMGAVAAQAVVLWISLVGTSPVTLIVLIASMSLGIRLSQSVSGMVVGDRAHQKDQSTSLAAFMPMIALTIALVALTWTAPELMSVLHQTGARWFAANSSAATDQVFLGTSLSLLMPGLVVLLLTASGHLWAEVCCPEKDQSSGNATFQRYASAAPGVCLLLIHQWGTFPMASTISSVVVLGIALRLLFAEQPFASTATTASDSLPGTSEAGEPQNGFGQIDNRGAHHWFEKWDLFSAALLSGIGIVSVSEFIVRLFPGDVPVLLLMVVVVTGILAAFRTRIISVAFGSGRVTASLILLSCFPFMFSVLVDLNLSIRASQISPWMVLAIRALQGGLLIAAAVGPMAFAKWTSDSAERTHRQRSGLTHAYVAAGMIFALLCLIAGTDPLILLIVSVGGQSLRLLVNSITERATVPRFRLYTGFHSLLLVVLPTAILFQPIDTSRASQLLFSSRTKAALDRGLDQELISQSDASRLMAKVETPDGEVHVWRRSGYVFEFRRNGRLSGRVSSDTRLTPQPAEDVLPAILPMVMHPAPNRILVIGDETGVCLRACSRLPFQRIVAVRGSEEVTRLASEFTWRSEELPPDQDSRVTIRHDLSAAVLGTDPDVPFDIVITSGESASTAGDCWEFTEEYYSAVRGQLSEQGVFCQRFRQNGLGARPLQQALATAMTAFPHVVAVQAAPGEILLIGSVQENGLIGEHVLSRLQYDYIRREIATTGLDWTQVAVLPIVDASDRIGIFSVSKPPEAISIANAGFVMSLPVEILRPGDRSAEIRETFAPHQIRLAEAMPGGEAQLEMNRRISALNQQIEILAGMPDAPWTYRKSLRMEMQRNPRPSKDAFRDGKLVRIPHPTDVMHQEYFVTLGDSIQRVIEGDHRFEAFSSIERFAAASEPLLSHFAHYELVRLHELAGHPSPKNEYRHRLHTVFFTEPTDASVRPVIAALEQLIEHPELLESDSERFDHLNSMIQELIKRWEARTAWEPRSAKRVEQDVDQSVRIVKLAMDRMEQWIGAVEMPREDFLRRRRFVNAALITPLQQYRDQVLAYRIRTEKPVESDSETPDDRPLVIAPPGNLSSN